MSSRPLRLLHTADWHLGARFHDQRRGPEEDHALDQIVSWCDEKAVDVVIVAGDVFDNANPGAHDERRYYRTLARLVRDAGVATTVVIAGNHDSALRLDGPRELAGALGVHVVGRFGRDADPRHAVVPLVDRQGSTRAVCAALPYLRDGDLRLPAPGEGVSEIHERYAAALEARYAAVREAAHDAYPGLPLVVTGHGFVRGGDLGGGERPVQIGGLGLVDADALAGDAVYLALGHLHRPQDVGRTHWRYSGSLLPTGFDETGTRREAILVEIDDSNDPEDGEPTPGRIERLPILPFRRYQRLAGNVADVEAAIERLPVLDASSDDEPTPWCEAVVELDGPRPGLARTLADRCLERGWSLVSVRARRPDRDVDAAPSLPRGLGLRELQPEDVFVSMHEAQFGTGPDEELLHEFRTLLEGLDAETLDDTSNADDLDGLA